jgi:TolA-binding protein
MNSLSRTTWFLAVAAVLHAAVAQAKPIDDAKAELTKKNYERVDKLLAKELAVRTPDVEALRLSLAAALAMGKPVTAEARIEALLKQKQDPALLLSGAKIAEILSDERMALTRYLAYARAETQKCDALEAAFSYVLQRDGYPEEFRKYVDTFGATDQAWSLAEGQWRYLVGQRDGERLLALADYLMQKWSAPAQVTTVQQWLYQACEGYLFGREPQARFWRAAVLAAKHQPGDVQYFTKMIVQGHAGLTDQQRAQFLIDVVKTTSLPPPSAIATWFSFARTVKDEAARLQLGRDFLANEKIYRNSKNPADYQQFLETVIQSPDVFNVKDKALLTREELDQKFEALRSLLPADRERLAPSITGIQQGWPQLPAARTAFLQKHFAVLDGPAVTELLDLTKNENFDQVVAEHLQGKSLRYTWSFRGSILGRYAALRKKAELLAAAKDYLAASPFNFDAQSVHSSVINSVDLSVDEKASLIRDCFTKAGHTVPLTDLIKRMVTGKPTAIPPQFLALEQEYGKIIAGSDPALRAHAAILKITRSTPDYVKLARDVAAQFLRDYKGVIPGDGPDGAKNLAELQAAEIFALHRDRAVPDAQTAWVWAELWAPRVGRGIAWTDKRRGLLAPLALDSKSGEAIYRIAPAYLALVKANDPGDPAVWDLLAQASYPNDGKPIVFASHYRQMGEAAARFLFRQFVNRKYNGPNLAEEFDKVVSAAGFEFQDQALWNGVLDYLDTTWAGKTHKVPLALSRALLKYQQAEAVRTGQPHTARELAAIDLQFDCGQVAEGTALLSEYLESVKSHQPERLLETYALLFDRIDLPEEAGATLKPAMRYHTLLKVLKPLYERVPADKWSTLPLQQGVFSALNIAEVKYKDTPEYSDVTGLRDLLAKITAAGAQLKRGDGTWVAAAYEAAILAQIEAENWGELMRLTPCYVGALKVKHLRARPEEWSSTLAHLTPLVGKLEAKNAYELAFAIISGVEHCGSDAPEGSRRQIALLKGRVAMQIPGLIPVPANHPAYDLYAAAHALLLGNEEQAWELTRLKLRILPDEWTALDPSYVAWTVEQMRKQKLLKPALDLAMTVLLREKELDPEIAARVSLTKGETYADMENYQAARLEFESLRNNPLYGKTEAGTLALNRLINLLIVTKDYTGAEGLLARLVDSDRLQSQAEGYYLYAKMAFLQGDYKEAAINLRKVKDRVTNHVEAALLQGEVNLHLPGGLQFTEVEIGNPKLSTIVVPGQVLTLKLNDANLSIAHGEASVPVLIKTTKGGDEESIKLLPSSANKNLFVGTIPTMLGKAQKSDLTLELRGDDQVTYEIEEAFQKANGLNYPPKTLDVRFDARMTASSGEILTEAEQEKIEMERRIRQTEAAPQVDRVKRYERNRNVRTVRPGGNIFVQVIDMAANLGDAPGTVKINLKTTSGDVLEGFELRETEAHSGIFRGAVPTGIPRPKAAASDTEEGRSVGGVINSTTPAPWVSLADGKRPKWLEVDTMSSYLVSSFRAEIADAASIREAALQWQLVGDYLELAHFPPRTEAAKGGLQLQVVNDGHGGTVDDMRGLIKWVGGEPAVLETTSFDRDKDAPPTTGDTWCTVRMTGIFYLPQRRVLALKFLQEPAPRSQHSAFLFIDQQPILAGGVNSRTNPTGKRVDLDRGIHHIEVLARDHSQHAKVIVGYETDEGTFAPLPKAWFSVTESPAVAAFLKPKATLKIDGTALVATLDQPQRLRKMRLVLQDYAGTAVTVKSLTINDEKGQAIVPAKEDFSSGKKSQSLQIAPGDHVLVSYEDSLAIGASKTLTTDLNAAFYNGSILLANEEMVDLPGGLRGKSYYPARRCRRGDQLVVIVDEHDADISDERDTVEVTVTTSAGEKLVLKALETELDNRPEPLHNHAGSFLATLKIGDQTGKDQIKVVPGDEITVSYLDKENTDPGVPVERTYTVVEAGGGSVEGLVYRTSVKQIEDTSEQAEAKKARIKARQGWAPVILKDLVVARHPKYQPPVAAAPAAAATATATVTTTTTATVATTAVAALPSAAVPPPAAPKKDDDVVVAINAPLLFEVTCPTNALNSASVMYVSAVPESELKAAAREGKEPQPLKVPMYLMPIEQLAAAKGIAIQLQSSARRDATQMLQDGTFAGIIRFEPGKRGEPVNDLISGGEDGLGLAVRREMDPTGFNYRVPTMRVSGADVVHISYQDPHSKQTTEWKVRLLSDGRMELMDPTFTGQNDTIHLGAKFAIRVVDPDRDTTDDRDTVQVRAKASSGDEQTLTLTETLPHSGVFETSFQPELIGEKGPDGKLPSVPTNKGDKLYVTFGDDVTFTYEDPQCVSPPGIITVTQLGHIAKGADAQLAVFSKQFKDPEMAVKTQFLTAEALFEMAKEHRKLDQKKKADEEITRGKTILEEAIRDYPRTSLTAQGDYLLANLAQELGDLQEAISRYAHVISTYPDSEYASASQFKKALCYEKLGNFDAACEEYVKLTYVYPDSNFVVDATLRLGTYYYKKESYQVAAKIFFNFKQKNPTHKMAPQALFLAAQCALKQKEYAAAAKLFAALVEEYPEEKALRAEAMYWMADSNFKAHDHKNAYRGFKRLTWDYPDSDWAKYARGRLSEEVFAKMSDE